LIIILNSFLIRLLRIATALGVQSRTPSHFSDHLYCACKQCSRWCTEYIHSFQHNLLKSSTLKVRLLFFCFVSLLLIFKYHVEHFAHRLFAYSFIVLMSIFIVIPYICVIPCAIISCAIPLTLVNNPSPISVDDVFLILFILFHTLFILIHIQN